MPPVGDDDGIVPVPSGPPLQRELGRPFLE